MGQLHLDLVSLGVGIPLELPSKLHVGVGLDESLPSLVLDLGGVVEVDGLQLPTAS